MRHKGAALLVPVLILITVAAFAVVVAASQSGGDIQASDANADGLQALYLADTGLERALKRFATGTACGAALGETLTNLATIGLGTTTHRIVIGAGLTSDFAGAALPATQCRIPVTGTVLASNVSRTLHAIVSRNLLEGPDNPSFDNPLTGATPSGWTGIDPVEAFAASGGPDGTAPNCRRSAWIARDNPGSAANDRRATASVGVNFTVANGSVTTFTFHRRVISRNQNCGALPPGGPAALPAACAAANDSTVCFQLTGGGTWSVGSSAGATAGPNLAACPTPFDPCSSDYPGYPAKTSVNVNMTANTTITQFTYWLQLDNAGRKELFLDNIEVTNPTAVGAASVRVWRDCSTAACP